MHPNKKVEPILLWKFNKGYRTKLASLQIKLHVGQRNFIRKYLKWSNTDTGAGVDCWLLELSSCVGGWIRGPVGISLNHLLLFHRWSQTKEIFSVYFDCSRTPTQMHILGITPPAKWKKMFTHEPWVGSYLRNCENKAPW